jgi:hypothetical protein
LLEHAINTKDFELDEGNFIKSWTSKKLNTMDGINSSKLDYRKYYVALRNGLNALKNKYKNPISEESIEWEYIRIDNYLIRIKGVIDLQCEDVDGN